jgi:hypothetical protein
MFYASRHCYADDMDSHIFAFFGHQYPFLIVFAFFFTTFFLTALVAFFLPFDINDGKLALFIAIIPAPLIIHALKSLEYPQNPCPSSLAAIANLRGEMSSVFKPRRSRKLLAALISACATRLIAALDIKCYLHITTPYMTSMLPLFDSRFANYIRV